MKAVTIYIVEGEGTEENGQLTVYAEKSGAGKVTRMEEAACAFFIREVSAALSRFENLTAEILGARTHADRLAKILEESLEADPDSQIGKEGVN